MERLTSRGADGFAWYNKCFESPCNGEGCRIHGCDHEYLVCDRLEKYEATGLSPEQIREIDKLYGAQCKELSALKEEAAAAKEALAAGRRPTMTEITRIVNIQGTAIIKCSNNRAEALIEDRQAREKKLAEVLKADLDLDDIQVEIHDFFKEEA